TLSNGVDLRRNEGTLTFSGGINSVANEGISFNLPTIVDTTPVDLNGGTLTITSNGNSPSGGSELNVAGNDWGLLRINFGGYLTLGAANVLPADADVEFGWHQQGSSSGTLDLDGFDQTVRSIGVTPAFPDLMGDQRITGGGTLTVDLPAAATVEYQGRITDGSTPTALTKDGAGTQILNNLSGVASSYTGPTTVNGGVLQAGTSSAFGSNSAVTVAPGAVLALAGNSNAIGALAGGGTVENAGPAGATVMADDFESGSVNHAGVRFREGDIDYGWKSRYDSAWVITGGRVENSSTTAGGYPAATPAEAALVSMITNVSAGSIVTLQFDYDVAAGDTLYVHFRGHSGTPEDDSLIVGNTEPCNGAYSNNEGGSFTRIDAFNLKDGATSFGGGAGDAIVALTGSGTYSTDIDIAALGIDDIGTLAGFSHLSLAFCKDEDGLAGTTSIDNLLVTSNVVTLAAGGDNTDSTFPGTMRDGAGAGVLGLSKRGTGTLTLTGGNTYTGDTVVKEGILQIGDGGTTGTLSPASPIRIAAAGTLCINRSDTVRQGVDFGGGPIGGLGTFAVKGGGTVVLTNNATFADDATVSVASGSILDLDFAGTMTVGTLVLDGVPVPAGTWGASGSGANNAFDSYFAGTGTMTVTITPPSTWDGGGGDANWTTAANWFGDFAPVIPARLVFAGTTNTATNNDYAAGSAFNRIDFSNTGAGEGFSLGGNDITLGGDISAAAAAGGISDSISLDMKLDGARSIILGESRDLVISGVISEDGSARSLTKLGPGALTLTAANAWSGDTNLLAGTTIVTNGAAFGTSPVIDMRDDEETGTTLVLGADGLSIPQDISIPNAGGTRTLRLDAPGTASGTLPGRVTVD
ncbi:MAG: hypothetical protein HKO57_01995, partial [Akkermansiaceae bacterium]|nr:hypothetical protein [Akkermansiaceae bacterium]